MIGARAADMIAEAVVAMEYRASAEDISRMSHAHPSFTEAIKEACLSVGDKALRSEEHTSELQSRRNLVCRLLLEKTKKNKKK